jgi:hypothetical protein
MFVLEALVLTFLTTPGVVLLYPPHLRRRVAKHPIGTSKTLEGDGEVPNEKGKNGLGSTVTREHADKESIEDDEKGRWSNVTVVLDRLEHLPGLICVSELLRRSNDFGRTVAGTQVASNSEPSRSNKEDSHTTFVDTFPVNAYPDDLSRLSTGEASLPGYLSTRTPFQTIHKKGMVLRALRLLELSDRTSAVMKSIRDSSALLLADPVVNIFKTIHELRGGFVRSIVKVEPVEEWPTVVEETVHDVIGAEVDGAELVVTCWLGAGAGYCPISSDEDQGEGTSPNPFDFFFHRSQPPALIHNKSANAVHQLLPASRETTTHAHFVRSLFAKSNADVALYVDNTSHLDSSLTRMSCPAGLGGHNTILLPFFGGPDCRAALDMVIQICKDSSVRGVIVRVTKGERGSEISGDEVERPPAAYIHGTIQSGYEGTIGNTVSDLFYSSMRHKCSMFYFLC